MLPITLQVRRRLRSAAAVLVGTLAAVLIFELAGRLLVEPDAQSYGRLLGIPLPPIRLIDSERPAETPRDVPYRGIVVQGQHITLGDLSGYHRYDALLGYTQRENARSVNGWWESNSIGARVSKPTAPRDAAGVTRLVLLGESFAHGNGLPAEDIWPSHVESAIPSLELVNLAVDGYGTAQAQLRYESLKGAIEHHGVLMMFVPSADLWRDVNTVRDVGAGGWNLPIVLPRYVLEQGRLALIRSPYGSPEDVYLENRSGLSPVLREHLRRFDRFYFGPFYDDPPLLGRSLTYKTIVAAWGQLDRNRRHREQFQSDSDAMHISREIFRSLERELKDGSKDFHVVVLPAPHDLELMRSDPKDARHWEQIVAAACDGIASCTDLAPDLLAAPVDRIDLAYDGSHYGPRANRVIAATVARMLGRYIAKDDRRVAKRAVPSIQSGRSRSISPSSDGAMSTRFITADSGT